MSFIFNSVAIEEMSYLLSRDILSYLAACLNPKFVTALILSFTNVFLEGFSTRAFHKLLEIFRKVSRNFSKSCSKVAFCYESCSEDARKNKNVSLV